jgi:long-chain acyl-CoA synthetase
MLPNSPQQVIAFFGTLIAGGIVVNVNPLYTPDELTHQLSDSEASVLVLLDDLWPRYQAVAPKVPIRQAILTGIEDFLPFPKNWLYRLTHRQTKSSKPQGQRFRALLKAPPAEPYPSSPNEVALLQYTGGTTGLAKGAMLTHANLLANVRQCVAWDPSFQELQGQGVALGALPFFHVYGMTVAMNYALAGGFKIVLMPRPEVKGAIRLIERHKVTHFPGVPTLYVGFNNTPGISRRRIQSIRVCISGSAPLPLEVARRFEELTGGKLVEGYGLTEASPVTHCNPILGRRKAGSIGLPLPGVEARIVDDQGRPLSPGTVGELAVRGPNVMKGYWRRPEETQAVLVEGWLLTGDLGYMDEEGYFYIVDRKKDLIIASGYNVYPREVEEVLFAHPAIQEAAVVGLPDPYRGETVGAFVVLKPGASLSESELDRYCREHLAAYKVPRVYRFVEELPKSGVGKILRRELKEKFLREHEQPRS